MLSNAIQHICMCDPTHISNIYTHTYMLDIYVGHVHWMHFPGPYVYWVANIYVGPHVIQHIWTWYPTHKGSLNTHKNHIRWTTWTVARPHIYWATHVCMLDNSIYVGWQIGDICWVYVLDNTCWTHTYVCWVTRCVLRNKLLPNVYVMSPNIYVGLYIRWVTTSDVHWTYMLGSLYLCWVSGYILGTSRNPTYMSCHPTYMWVYIYVGW